MNFYKNFYKTTVRKFSPVLYFYFSYIFISSKTSNSFLKTIKKRKLWYVLTEDFFLDDTHAN